jgi:hypothetical protein
MKNAKKTENESEKISIVLYADQSRKDENKKLSSVVSMIFFCKILNPFIILFFMMIKKLDFFFCICIC